MNYNASNLPTNLSTEWSIKPNISATTAALTLNNSTLTVRSNGFVTMTTYNITVIVTNKNSTDLIQRTASYVFTTSRPPYSGTVSITPTTGYIYETNMTVTLLNW